MTRIPPQIRDDLEHGASVVVPSRQRAAAVRLAHAAAMLERGARVWKSVDVLPWSGFLERECARAAEAGEPVPRLLRPAEEWLLWRESVDEAAEALDILPAAGLAESIQRAVQTMSAWRVPRAVLRTAGTREAELLAGALERFESRCAAVRAAAPHRLPELLGTWRPAAPLTFAGFSETTASREALAQAWSARGCAVREHRGEDPPGRAFIAALRDPSAELEAAAHWCRAQLEADPRRRLLVVIPDLAERRDAVVRTFEQTLAPRAALGEARSDASFAIEGGQPLSTYPLVRHALASLRLLVRPREFADLSAWLRGVFWSGPDAPARARLDLWLREVATPVMDARDLLLALEGAPAALAAAAGTVRTALAGALRELGEGTAAPAHWARRIAAALTALGWPGSRVLTSGEQQTKQRFAEVLEELARLPAGVGAMSAREAVFTLCELADRVPFEPATGDVAVTVSGAPADPIVRYDGIWVAGLHADVWPQPRRFDPFIPIPAQRAAGIPAASARRLLAQARTLLALWQRAAAELVVSWPEASEAGEHLPSPLLAELPGIETWRPGTRRASLARALRGAPAFESVEDEAGEPWPGTEPLPAGTRSIEFQGRCPFRAYAELRLGCTALESPRHGIDARDRGRLLHRALELLWIRLGDSTALRARHGADLEALIEECVGHAVEQSFGETARRVRRKALVREHRRAARLLAELCRLELERAPFKVRALESGRRLTIAGAAVELRIDRIDELADGSVLIFDYKTGRPQPQDWFAERISQPQLLVYLLAERAAAVGVAAVHLSPARVTFRGVADRKGRLPRVDALGTGDDADVRWREHVDRWQGQIERLVEDFLAGRAPVDPLALACRTCHLHCLCRIAEPSPGEESVSADE